MEKLSHLDCSPKMTNALANLRVTPSCGSNFSCEHWLGRELTPLLKRNPGSATTASVKFYCHGAIHESSTDHVKFQSVETLCKNYLHIEAVKTLRLIYWFLLLHQRCSSEMH